MDLCLMSYMEKQVKHMSWFFFVIKKKSVEIMRLWDTINNSLQKKKKIASRSIHPSRCKL